MRNTYKKEYENDKVQEIANKYNIMITDIDGTINGKTFLNDKPYEREYPIEEALPIKIIDKTIKIIITLFFILPLLLMATLFLFIGGKGIFTFVHSRKVCTESVTGYVIDYKEIVYTNKGKTTTYRPVFGYSYNNNEYTYEGHTSSSKKEYEIGQQIEVRVDPDSPDVAYVPEYKDNSIFFVIPEIICLGIYLVPIYLIFERKKK